MAPAAAVGAAFSAALAVYARTCYRTAAGGDSAEFIVAGALFPHVLAHPPGYPLFTALCALALRCAAGPEEAALAANLLCAGLGAAAAAAVFGASSELVAAADSYGSLEPHRALAAALSAVLFALHPTVWLYSIQAEVFALNNCLLGLLLLLFLRVARAGHAAEGSLPTASLAALVSGLALSNQHTAALFVGPLALGTVACRAPLRRRLAWLLLCGAAGLLPYAYLPLAQRRPCLFTWPAETDTLRGFLGMLLRKDYGTLQLQATTRWEKRLLEPVGDGERAPLLEEPAQPSVEWWPRLLGNAAHFMAAATVTPVHRLLFLPGAVLGAVSCLLTIMVRRTEQRAAGLGLALAGITLSLGVYLIVMCSLSNFQSHDGVMGGIMERFWMQPLLALAPLHAVGVARALAWASACCPAAGRGLLRSAAGAAAAAVAAGLLQSQWASMDHSEDAAVEDFYGCAFEAMPRNATMLIRGDTPTNLLRYWQAVRGLRPDVLLLAAPLLSGRLQRLAGPAVKAAFGLQLPADAALHHFLNDGSEASGPPGGKKRPLVLLGYYTSLGPRSSSLWPLPGFDLWPLPGPSRLVLPDAAAAKLDPMAWVQRQLRQCRCSERFQKAVARGAAWERLPESSWERHAVRNYWSQLEHLVVHGVHWAAGVATTPGADPGTAAKALDAAAALGDRLIRLSPEVSPSLARCLGLAHHLRNDTERWLHLWGSYILAAVAPHEASMQARLQQVVCTEYLRQVDPLQGGSSGAALAQRVAGAVPALPGLCAGG